MKKRAFLKLIALAVATVTLLGSIAIIGTAEGICIHSTNKELIATDDGFAIANVCTLCGKRVTDVGYVSDNVSLALYKDTAKTPYTESELKSGFSPISKETPLYVDTGVISSSGKDPYWFTFDMKVNTIPNLKEGSSEADLSNSNSRASKGWALITMVLNGNYSAPLRLMADGWENESGADGTKRGEVDGYSEIKFYGDKNTYRDQPTITKVKNGDTVSFALRVDPVNGNYDVYVNNAFAGSGNIPAKSDGTNPYIRLWEDSGISFGGSINITNIEFFKESFTKAIHTHEYTQVLDFDDEGFSIYNVCECGYRILLPSEKITSVVSDGLSHIYDGLGSFTVDANTYWFVTDINVRQAPSDGSLIKFGSDTVLEIKDGRLYSGDKTIAVVTYPTTYQIAIKIISGAYDLYVNGRPATSGKTSDTVNITCGDESFGHHVRFLYNKAVTLGEEGKAVVPTYTADTTIKRCNHSDSDTKAEQRIVKKGADGYMKYIYNCTKCGERVYSRLSGDLTNPNNDTAYKNKTNSMLRSELRSLTTDTQKVLYLENNVISKTSAPYWISFSVTPNSIASPESGDIGDPNTNLYRGYNMLSVESSYYPISQLRIIPDGWEAESGANGNTKGTADGIAEVKILKETIYNLIGTDSVNYRTSETVAYLEVGKTTDFALRIDPSTGVYDVYVDGEYKASAMKSPVSEHFPKIVFHDFEAGNYTYSNIKIAAEDRNYSDTVTAIELTSTFTPDSTANTSLYTPMAQIKRVGAGESKILDLIYVHNRSGKLAINTQNGIKFITDKAGDNFTLNGKGVDIAIIYDDVNGTIRYYVDEVVAYVDGKIAINLPIYDSEFASFDATADIVKADYNIVDDIKTYAIHASGLPKVVGFQTHEETGEIRILAGLDMHWYGSVGYTVECYDESGKLIGKQTVEGDVIYEKVVAEGKEVYATYYGFNYFAPLKISDVNYFDHKGYSLVVTPFTKIGGIKYTGEAKKLIVNENGYEYDTSFIAE